MQDGSYNSFDDATFVTWSLFVGGICYEDVRTRVRARITAGGQEFVKMKK